MDSPTKLTLPIQVSSSKHLVSGMLLTFFSTVRIVGGIIQGFLVQARLPGNNPQLGMNPMLLGSFQPGTGHQIYDCDGLTGAVSEVSERSVR